jgi:Raf kinase inhibitor-like YbhB/YbcL family protein
VHPFGILVLDGAARRPISSPVMAILEALEGRTVAIVGDPPCLVLDDPDAPDPKAPKRVWVHWVVYNLPPDAKGLPENASRAGLPEGAASGVNDSKQAAYNGPCPPIGRHRYFHKLYALDIALPGKGLTKAGLEAAIKGHVLAQAELMGTYQKGDP